MGRYPLRTAIGEYLRATNDYYSPTTQVVRKAVLYAIEREYSRLVKRNPDLKLCPKDWKEPEIVALLTSMRANGLTHATQAQRLSLVKKLLMFQGNNILDKMKATNPQVFPKAITERKGSLSDEELSRVLKATEEKDGWTGECMRFVFPMYAYTGMRLSELASASRDDLDTSSWTIRVSHPKGERSYGRQRVIPIPEPLRPVVIRFLKAREKHLALRGLLETTPLVFPNGRPDKCVDNRTVGSWKTKIVERSGVRFTVHALRRTYGQNLLNRDVPIETVSLMLGHSTTQTTERHYCRRDEDSARLDVIRAFRNPAPVLKTPELTRPADLTGYA